MPISFPLPPGRTITSAGAVMPLSNRTPVRSCMQVLVCHGLIARHQISLGDLKPRMHQTVGEFTVIGEQQHARRIPVKTPDRKYPLARMQDIHHRCAALFRRSTS